MKRTLSLVHRYGRMVLPRGATAAAAAAAAAATTTRALSSSCSTEAIVDRVRVAKSSPATTSREIPPAYGLENETLTEFVDDLLQQTRVLMDGIHRSAGEATAATVPTTATTAHHVIAFSGGIDSSVVAALVHAVATSPRFRSGTYHAEKVTAVLGLSPAVPLDQRRLAEDVATAIGVTLEQVETTEGTDDLYVANDGRACLACKTHLYDNLKTIATAYCGNTDTVDDGADSNATANAILYNGTNADDKKDPTRLGLIAADDFGVRSPLANLSKQQVRDVGRHLGLPNWDHAASPCLRSRLAVGVHATPFALRDVGTAEAFVRESLPGPWDHRKSLRVRILSKNRAMIEVDDDTILEQLRRLLPDPTWETYFKGELGFAAVDARKFKTGSVAPSPDELGAIEIETEAAPANA